MAHTKQWILDHYTCEGQLTIHDLPFSLKDVDNFDTDVDNIDWRDICLNCTVPCCDLCPHGRDVGAEHDSFLWSSSDL